MSKPKKKWCGSCHHWKYVGVTKVGQAFGNCIHPSKAKHDFLMPVEVPKRQTACDLFERDEDACCDAEDRGWSGWCESCGDPCL